MDCGSNASRFGTWSLATRFPEATLTRQAPPVAPQESLPQGAALSRASTSLVNDRSRWKMSPSLPASFLGGFPSPLPLPPGDVEHFSHSQLVLRHPHSVSSGIMTTL